MLKKLMSIFGGREKRGRFVGRRMTHDIAFQFRMGAGFPGDVNRGMGQANVEPTLLDPTTPFTVYGVPGVINPANNGFRPLSAGDQALADVYGVLARPFPYQQRTGGDSSAFGGGIPPLSGIGDAVRSGYVMVQLNGGAAVVKGGQVFIWTAASAGQHVQGGFEGAAVGGSGIALPLGKYQFNGPADANGIVEISWNV